MDINKIKYASFLDELEKIAQIGNMDMPFKPMSINKPFQKFINNTAERPEIEPESSSLEEYEG